MSENTNTQKYFSFINQINKVNAITGQVSNVGVIESLSKGIQEVFEKYPKYVGKYFKTIAEYSLDHGEFAILLNSLNDFLRSFNFLRNF